MRVVHLLSILSEVGRSFNFVVLVCYTDLFLQHLLDSIAGRASDHPSLLSHFLFWASPLDNCGSGTHIAEGSRAQLGGGGAGCIAGRWSWCSVVQQSPRWFLTTEVRSGFGRGVERWVGLKKACKKEIHAKWSHFSISIQSIDGGVVKAAAAFIILDSQTSILTYISFSGKPTYPDTITWQKAIAR